MNSLPPPHAVSRLRSARLERSTRPFLARGGPHGERCAGCRLILSHCFCDFRTIVPSRAGICLLMAEHETLKPSNTGWLIADVIPETTAFGWARTTVEPALLALLADPQWQPYVVFPGEFVAPERVVSELIPDPMPDLSSENGPNTAVAKRPLFILLDATWPEARKIFNKSPYLNQFPVLSLAPDQVSRYRLRRSRRDDHLCTSEVAAICMALAGDTLAAQTLAAYLDVFTDHYLRAKQQIKLDTEDEVHQRLRELSSLNRQTATLEQTIPPQKPIN
jgi:DTW domain-containing protein YfiP